MTSTSKTIRNCFGRLGAGFTWEGIVESDVIDAGNRWLPPEEYSFVRAKVPILCVDVLLSPRGRPETIGLIRRPTYNGGRGWCLVGGRVLRNEQLGTAVERHVTATLGDSVRVDLSTLAMRTVVEYFTEPSAGDFYDPRKHAVALTYTATCDGVPHPRGEALGFRWFEVGDLRHVDFGFGQGNVVSRVVAGMGREDERGQIPGPDSSGGKQLASLRRLENLLLTL